MALLQVRAAVQRLWKPIAGERDDYIANPKVIWPCNCCAVCCLCCPARLIRGCLCLSVSRKPARVPPTRLADSTAASFQSSLHVPRDGAQGLGKSRASGMAELNPGKLETTNFTTQLYSIRRGQASTRACTWRWWARAACRWRSSCAHPPCTPTQVCVLRNPKQTSSTTAPTPGSEQQDLSCSAASLAMNMHKHELGRTRCSGIAPACGISMISWTCSRPDLQDFLCVVWSVCCARQSGFNCLMMPCRIRRCGALPVQGGGGAIARRRGQRLSCAGALLVYG